MYIWLEYPSANPKIDRFITLVKSTEEKSSTTSNRDRREKQNIFTAASQEAPKVLADIFKSVAAAIYQDFGYEIDVVWKICVTLIKEAFEMVSLSISTRVVKLKILTNKLLNLLIILL